MIKKITIRENLGAICLDVYLGENDDEEGHNRIKDTLANTWFTYLNNHMADAFLCVVDVSVATGSNSVSIEWADDYTENCDFYVKLEQQIVRDRVLCEMRTAWNRFVISGCFPSLDDE